MLTDRSRIMAYIGTHNHARGTDTLLPQFQECNSRREATYSARATPSLRAYLDYVLIYRPEMYLYLAGSR
jgi:hypothetical protein